MSYTLETIRQTQYVFNATTENHVMISHFFVLTVVNFKSITISAVLLYFKNKKKAGKNTENDKETINSIVCYHIHIY